MLLGPHHIKVVRRVTDYALYPEAGPGRWQVMSRDTVTKAALDAARSGIRSDMLAVLLEKRFSRGVLRKRLVELAALKKAIHGT